MIIVTQTWQTQLWNPLLLKMSMQCPLLLPPPPLKETNTLYNSNRKLTLPAWKVTGNPLKWKELQAMQGSVYPNHKDWVLLKAANRPGTSGLAGMLGKQWIHFVYL